MAAVLDETLEGKHTNELSFEIALKELEGIAQKLENVELSLEEAVTSYERGVELKRYCEEVLENVRTRIEIINQKDFSKQCEDDFSDSRV